MGCGALSCTWGLFLWLIAFAWHATSESVGPFLLGEQHGESVRPVRTGWNPGLVEPFGEHSCMKRDTPRILLAY